MCRKQEIAVVANYRLQWAGDNRQETNNQKLVTIYG